jgi:nitrate/nitrite transport system permease protein
MSVVSIKKGSLANIMAANETEISMATVTNIKVEQVLAEPAKLAEVKPSKAKPSEVKQTKVKLAEPSKLQLQLKAFMQWLLPPVFGLLMLLAVWALISAQAQGLPGPVKTFQSAVELFSHPFYVNGPNDQGIGWNIIASLKRVGLGFGLAALVGIPLGFMIGRFEFLNRMTAPVISLLRPVSPLAWLPIGLLVFKAANPAAIWVIFISAIWPMIINTAVGVSKVPQDYMNVAKVLNLSEWKIVTKILFPSVLPYMMTGVRLSIGVAWLVIVAAEMLTGGVGIGFWVWDEWNNLNVEHIIIAIFVVGIVGLLLEQGLLLIARRFAYE